ncbi:MAG: PIN domain-containing protein [Ilumatobacteraceae bacterium]
MARILLDSTVIIDALRGRPAAAHLAALRRRRIEPWVCAISVEEIWRGLRHGEEDGVRRFFGAVHIAPIGAPEGELAGTWRRSFADQGITLHQADCLIAAAARGIDAPLATANTRDFPMEELVVEHWPVGA